MNDRITLVKKLFFTSLITIFSFLSLNIPVKAASLNTQEKINSYNVEIKINEDGSLDIVENINVTSTGAKIKRGIFRDFPTKSFINNVIPNFKSFEVVQVLKDGIEEPYHLERYDEGTRLYIGDKNTYLKRGVYNYTLKFRTQNQVSFFEDHDELYFNAIGHNWDFAIDKVSVTVLSPKGTKKEDINVGGFTGLKGATTKNFIYQITGNEITFTTNKPLAPKEGFTVVVGWPKGFVNKPNILTRASLYLMADKYFVYSFLVLISIIVYYLFVWYKVGKDPESSETFSIYDVPKNVSPALISYINKMGFDRKSISASILNLAINNQIKITESRALIGSNFTLTKISNSEDVLFSEEKELINDFFNKSDSFTINSKNSSTLQSAVNGFKSRVVKMGEEKYVKQNLKYMYLPVMLSVLLYAVLSFISVGSPGPLMIIVLNVLFIFGSVTIIVQSLIPIFKARFNFKSVFKIIISLLALLLFVIMTLALTIGLSEGIGILSIIVINLSVLTHCVFFYTLKARTLEGKVLLNQIEGLKKYLTAVENPRFQSKLHEEIPFSFGVYEKYLPYAIALGVEPVWTDRLQQAIKNSELDVTKYSPIWYSGYRNFDFNSISKIDRSLNLSISNWSGSKSNSGFSGGFSGGGSGGGGGGGW